MKLSYNWLREWIDPKVSAEALTTRITLAGLESDAAPMTEATPTGVVVGRIVKAERHPQADKLQVCEVDVGNSTPLQIVCGASNARVGIHVPCATVGAKLPGIEIKQAKLRGVDSFGMLCSAKELGLGDKSEGLLELDREAKPGTPIAQHLGFDDDILNLELTPNRGDCLSVLGLAREVAALYRLPLRRPDTASIPVTGHKQIEVKLDEASSCSAYAGRVITGLNAEASTPDWMRERLRRSGIRSIHPVVDITNYVLLELGQPMHAFDCAKLNGGIHVRKARAGETLALLNEQTVTLNHSELVIADERSALALAGVMGGTESSVTRTTTDIFFESACFAPESVALTGRRHKLNSDSLYRFERGVDPALQREALERATQLTLQICGGEAHPITFAGREQPEACTVRLRHSRVRQLLGIHIDAQEIESLLAQLGLKLVKDDANTWQAQVPNHRYDLRIEHDLIEEIARLYGYDRIVAQPYAAQIAPSRPAEAQRSLARSKDLLTARGWQEAITLSFVDPRIQSALTPDTAAIPLDNPIAETLAVMRTTLWSGLIPAWLHNHQRQQKRVRLFETGVCFEASGERIVETPRIGGLVTGAAQSEQWGNPSRAVDFYDLKADVIALLGHAATEYRFEPATHPALHPGRSARILRGPLEVGWIGEMHPQVVKQLDLPEAPYLFELDWVSIRDVAVPRSQPLSDFPSSRRDLAIVVSESVTAQQICDAAKRSGGNLLQNVFVFDIYRGKGLSDACKSVALGLIFNDYSRTLTVEEVEAAMTAITASLKGELGAAIRS